MTSRDSPALRPLLDRLLRLAAADAWSGQLTPTQVATLDYLSRANRFSRAPSQVADYLGATRGTVSQTLRSLERRGLVREGRSRSDRRRIRYDVTAGGEAALQGEDRLGHALEALPAEQRGQLGVLIQSLLAEMLRLHGGRRFGLCHACRHHGRRDGGAYCALLDLPLESFETTQICHEQEEAA